MTPRDPLVFADLPGYTPHISRLLAMMHYTRETTLHAVAGLSTAQLDRLPHPKGNAVGMLLAHIAAVEKSYYQATVVGGEPDWETPALALGGAGRETLRGRPLESYLSEFARVRAQTLGGLLDCDDAWLHDVDTARGTPVNNDFK
jgi:hypothetical protein